MQTAPEIFIISSKFLMLALIPIGTKIFKVNIEMNILVMGNELVSMGCDDIINILSSRDKFVADILPFSQINSTV